MRSHFLFVFLAWLGHCRRLQDTTELQRASRSRSQITSKQASAELRDFHTQRQPSTSLAALLRALNTASGFRLSGTPVSSAHGSIQPGSRHSVLQAPDHLKPLMTATLETATLEPAKIALPEEKDEPQPESAASAATESSLLAAIASDKSEHMVSLHDALQQSLGGGSFDAVEAELQRMKVAGLKDLVKLLGHKPGNLRKAELANLCSKQLLLEMQFYGQQDKPSQTEGPTLESRSEVSQGEVLMDEEMVRSVKRRLLPKMQPTLEAKSDEASSSIAEVEKRVALDGKAYTKQEFKDFFKDDWQWHWDAARPLGQAGASPLSQSNSSLKCKFPSGSWELRNKRMEELGMADMDLMFLGTASCSPGYSRGVTCISFRSHERKAEDTFTWLFDVGESSQLKMMDPHCTARPSKIDKIFLTHLHGDHSFGLPGVLCFMGEGERHQKREKQKRKASRKDMDPIDIYGPEGTRDFVRAIIQLSHSSVLSPFRIHELKNVPLMTGRHHRKAAVQTEATEGSGELPGGQDIYPDENGHYHLFQQGELSVSAAPMEHTVPCVGYVVKENDRQGRLKVDEIRPLLERNRAAFKEQGIRDPNREFRKLKAIQPGENYTFPDGTVLQAEDIVEPQRPGRKIVIMGDTSSGDHIASLAQGADVLVHEATNAWLSPHDGPSYQSLEYATRRKGHSTPQMAGRFAKRIGAKRLVLTHFSQRYPGDASTQSMKWMWEIEDMARHAGDMWGRNDVIAAWDFMDLPIKAN